MVEVIKSIDTCPLPMHSCPLHYADECPYKYECQMWKEELERRDGQLQNPQDGTELSKES